LSRIRRGAGARSTAVTDSCPLTSRQIDVVRLAASGKTAKQSARRLGLSVRTVESYLAQARKRTGAASIGELIAWTVAAGVVSRETTSLKAPDEGDGEAKRAIVADDHVQKCEIPEHDHEEENSSLVAEGHRRGRGRPTVMSAERIARASEMLTSCTVKEVAAKLGVSRGTLYAHMREIRAGRAAASVGAPK
jgi:DNA-binding CsgD family transcriptional regulator